MRYEIKCLMMLLLVRNLSIAGQAEVPEELATELVHYFDGLLCRDSLFASCVGVDKSRCSELLPEVLDDCDYRSVWNEIETTNTDDLDMESTESASLDYGACVNSRFIDQFSIDPAVFENCLGERMERYLFELKKEEMVD